MKNILKYLVVCILLVSVLFLLLVCSSKIPRTLIQENLEKSTGILKQNFGIEEILKRREYSTVHYYADSVLLNIIACIDSDNFVESTMKAQFFREVQAALNTDFIDVIESQKQPNEEYLRYWHGSMSIIRPLLIFLDLEKIYLVNKILMYSLALFLTIMLFKRNKKISIVFVLSMIMISFMYVPYCLEYSWTFYIMLITSIISVLIEKKGNSKLYMLFFITGILTCFFDFLTTEIITFLVPVLLVLMIRKEEGRLTNFKEGFKFLVVSCALWSVAYVFMWFCKWLLASIILNINAIEYVKSNLLLRINGTKYELGFETATIENMYIDSVYKNWFNLYPINVVKNQKHLFIIILSFCIIFALFIDWKNIKKKWFAFLLFLVALFPYARFLVLANHSYVHSYFTFRAQIISCISLIFAALEVIDYNKLYKLKKILFKKIELKKYMEGRNGNFKKCN